VSERPRATEGLASQVKARKSCITAALNQKPMLHSIMDPTRHGMGNGTD
jgi:hypothetical protein